MRKKKFDKEMQNMIDFIESIPQEERDRMAREVEAKLAEMTEEEREELMMDVFFGNGPEAEPIKRKLRDLSGVDPKDYRPEVVRSIDLELQNLFRPDDRPGKISSAVKSSYSFGRFTNKMFEDSINGIEQNRRLNLSKSETAQKELLARNSRKDLQNYCKYLGITLNGNENRKCMAELVAEELRANKDYFIYTVEREEAEMLMQLWNSFKKKNGIAQIPINEIEMLIQLGYIELTYGKNDGFDTVIVGYTEELLELLRFAVSGKAKGKYSMVDTMDRRTMSIIHAYGMIEINALYDMYCENYKMPLSFDEYRRYLYWRLRMTNTIMTGEYGENVTRGRHEKRGDHGEYVRNVKPYAAAEGLDLKAIATVLVDYTGGNEYKKYSLTDFERIGKIGIEAINPAIRMFEQSIAEMLPDDEERIDYINELMPNIISGLSMTDLMEDIDEYKKELYPEAGKVDILQQAYLWYGGMQLIMETGLAGLKGYSRREYLGEGKTLPPELSVFRITRSQKQNTSTFKDVYKSDTRLQDMPENIQFQIYEMTADADNQEAASKLQAIRHLYGDNAAIRTLEAGFRYEAGDDETCLKLLKEAAAMLPEEKSDILWNRIKQYHRNAENRTREAAGKQRSWDKSAAAKESGSAYAASQHGSTSSRSDYDVTQLRTGRKIGRNEPCPCGSGKKYKNCCGRS